MIEFESNVERTLYNLFDELCRKLGYDPVKHTRKGRYSDIEEFTFIDGKSYVLLREVCYSFSLPQTKIIIAKDREKITHHELRIKIFGYNPAVDAWYLFSKIDEAAALNKKYHSQRADPSKIEEVLEDLINFLRS